MHFADAKKTFPASVSTDAGPKERLHVDGWVDSGALQKRVFSGKRRV